MILVIAGSPARDYLADMLDALWKLFALLALVVMPFGMGTASAAPMHPGPEAATAQHCGEHGSKPQGNAADRTADCAIACSMLMASEARISEPLPSVRLADKLPPITCFVGIQPDTATPPPKFS